MAYVKPDLYLTHRKTETKKIVRMATKASMQGTQQGQA
jgi:hypothetical protein